MKTALGMAMGPRELKSFTSASRAFFRISILFLLGAIFGCSAKQTQSPMPTVPVVQATSLGQLHLPPLLCANSKVCPVAVGQLIVSSQSGQTAMCTASLVRPNVILTASHCVPWLDLSPEQSFQGGCWFRNAAGETGSCLRVLQASRLTSRENQDIEDDYAYIELQQNISARPLRVANRLSKKDIWKSDGSGLSVHLVVARVAQVSGLGSDEVMEQPCHPEPHAELSHRDWTPDRVRIFSGCQVRHGDSGGPLIDDDGEIRGVVSLYWESRTNANNLYSVISRPASLDQ